MADAVKTLFSTRSMIQAVEQWKEPQQFLLNVFFPEIKTYRTRYVEINFKDEKRRIAPFIHRRGTGQLVEKTGYDKFIWEPPYVKPKSNIEPQDLQEAMINENVYSDKAPEQRLVEFRNMILMDLERMIQRREELMAKQILFDKSITITDEDGAAIGGAITVTRESELAFSAGTAWSDTANASPLTDVEKASRLIQKHTGLIANICVMGRTSADEFVKNASVQSMLDNRRFEIGSITWQRLKDLNVQGARYLGTINEIEYYRYDEHYINPADGVQTELIDAEKVLVGSSYARGIRHYGAIETLEGPAMARRWPKFYRSENMDPEVQGVQIHSAPLPMTHQPNAYAVIST